MLRHATVLLLLLGSLAVAPALADNTAPSPYGVTEGSGDVTITAAGSDATADSAGVVRLTV